MLCNVNYIFYIISPLNLFIYTFQKLYYFAGLARSFEGSHSFKILFNDDLERGDTTNFFFSLNFL